MNRMPPDLARLLVEERVDEAEQQRRRHAARNGAKQGPRVPEQRRGSGLLARIVPRTGVRTDTR